MSEKTTIDLDAIRRRAEAATPGPWITEDDARALLARIAELERERDAAVQRAERLEAALRQVEWSEMPPDFDERTCPSCLCLKRYGHSVDCAIHAALEAPHA